MKRVLYLSTFIVVLSSFAAQAQTKMACLLGDTLTINLNNTRGEIQWQSSSDSLEWVDIAGQNTSTLDFLPNSGNQWVRAVITEDNCPEFIDETIRVSALDTSLVGIDPNVVVMDTVIVAFVPDSLQQLQGIYQFNCNTPESPLQPGDLIIGTEGEGYLRSIDAYTLQNGVLVTYTHQATLDDLFDDAAFSFEISADSLESRSVGFNYDIDEIELYQNGPVTLSLSSGNVNMTGDWSGDMEYSLLGGLESFNFGTDNTVLQSNFNFNLTVAQAVELLNGEKSLAEFTRNVTVLAAGVPVVITLSAELIATYELELSAEAQMNASLSSSLAVNTGFNFSNDQWGSNLDIVPTNTIEFTSPEGQVQAVLKLGLIPQVKMKIYGVVGPYINPGANVEVTGTVASPELNWDIKAEGYGTIQIGIEVGIDIDPDEDEVLASILGEPETFETDPYQTPSITLYKTPYELELVSGDNQSGEAGEMLADSIIIVVKDTFGISQHNVPVEILVSSGGGSVSESNLLSDDNGRVGITWTLGEDLQVDQELSFIVKNGSNEQVEGSPLIVTTSSGDCPESVTDIDGNEYPIVQIGDQCWTAENLKTTRFADGSVIQNITESLAWLYSDTVAFVYLNTPAWCNYDNSAANDIIYGKLYNWFTVADPRNVCPTGWHVPTDAEWMVLTDYLGGQDVAGGKMKTTTGWQSPNFGATNESGFSGLPGGERSINDGNFYTVGLWGDWWSSSESSAASAWDCYLDKDNAGAFVGSTFKQNGFSVRCLRD